MAILFSKEFGVDEQQMSTLGVFNPVIDGDSHFFINIKLLQKSTAPEFLGAYDKINDFFRTIGLLLSNATKSDKEDLFYRNAFNKFNFPEVNGLNLGFASGTSGSGFGAELRQQIMSDAFKIIKSGSTQPEIFHLIGLFEENVGPDRLSDMFGRLIYDNIISYTKRINKELGITPEKYPLYNFDDGILFNPYKQNVKILLLPKEILHKLPIAKNWDDITRVCSENEAIRAEINELISTEWAKMPTSQKKSYLKKMLFENPNKLNRVIDAYRSASAEPFNIYSDIDYIISCIKSTITPDKHIQSLHSLEAALYILSNYKHWVEYNRGSIVLCNCNKRKAEDIVHYTFLAVAKIYCTDNNWDIIPESDIGRGRLDFKISRGNDKTVVEFKLTSNPQCVHGLETQIEEYALAEQTENKIYALIDNGECSYRIEEVNNSYNEMSKIGKNPAQVIIIDANPKESASKYI